MFIIVNWSYLQRLDGFAWYQGVIEYSPVRYLALDGQESCYMKVTWRENFWSLQNFLLFRAMREADKKRERLLNCRQKAAAASARGESKESKKIRDSNTTTLMLIVVITVNKHWRFTHSAKLALPRQCLDYEHRLKCSNPSL